MSGKFPRIFTGPRRKPWRFFVLALVVLTLGFAPVAVDALSSPRTWVSAPIDGATVTDDVVVRGGAKHSEGVASVRLVVKNLDESLYWNGTSWQSGFTRVEGELAKVGAKKTKWSYTVPAEAMTEGKYRARAFARSVEGNGDAFGGDTNEFRYIPGLDAELYKTKILAPANRSVVDGPISIQGKASSSDGVDRVVVTLRNDSTKQYWDGQQWSSTFVRVDAKLDNKGAKKVEWTVDVPPSLSEEGSYFARAWVRTSTGLGDPFGQGRTSFTVQSSGEPPVTTATTIVAPTTSPTTAPPTTPVTSTTVPTTVAPTTVTPTTGTPTTRPTTVAPTTAPPTTVPTTVAPTTAPSTTAPPTTAQPGCSGGNPGLLIPCQGLLIGASGDFTNSDGSVKWSEDDFVEMEERLDAKFDIYHDFLQWRGLTSKQFPNDKMQAIADSGHTLFVNWKSPTSHPRDWAKIADGDYDADIETAARQVQEFGEPMFLTFFHEPEDEIRDVTESGEMTLPQVLADYRAAYRHLHDVFEANGADNAVWVWDMMGYLPRYEGYYEGGMYPGDDVVDWVAWDPYNWVGCANHPKAKWKSFTDVVSPYYDWLEEGGPNRPSTSKPLMLAEFGTEENRGYPESDQTKAEWLDEARSVLPTRFPRLKAVVYFDTEGKQADGSVKFCEWAIDSSDSSLAAMRRLVTDPTLDPVWSGN